MTDNPVEHPIARGRKSRPSREEGTMRAFVRPVPTGSPAMGRLSESSPIGLRANSSVASTRATDTTDTQVHQAFHPLSTPTHPVAHGRAARVSREEMHAKLSRPPCGSTSKLRSSASEVPEQLESTPSQDEAFGPAVLIS